METNDLKIASVVAQYLKLNQAERMDFLEWCASIDPKIYETAPLCEPLKKFLRHDD